VVNSPAPAAIVPLGVMINESVRVGDHIAYFWQTDEDFGRGCNFLAVGLEREDCCVAFGPRGANQRVRRWLDGRGLNVRDLRARDRLRFVEVTTAADTLKKLASTFRKALVRGVSLIRVLGNAEWEATPRHGDQGLMLFEAQLTAAAKAFPLVVLCMYDARTAFGSTTLHGALRTHPLMAQGNVLRVNTSYEPVIPVAQQIAFGGAADTTSRRKAKL
jgi:hypothetical protein